MGSEIIPSIVLDEMDKKINSLIEKADLIHSDIYIIDECLKKNIQTTQRNNDSLFFNITNRQHDVINNLNSHLNERHNKITELIQSLIPKKKKSLNWVFYTIIGFCILIALGSAIIAYKATLISEQHIDQSIKYEIIKYVYSDSKVMEACSMTDTLYQKADKERWVGYLQEKKDEFYRQFTSPKKRSKKKR